MVTRECMLTTVMTVGAAWEVGLATETGIFGAAVDRQPNQLVRHFYDDNTC